MDKKTTISKRSIVLKNVILGEGTVVEAFCVLGKQAKTSRIRKKKTIIGKNSILRCSTIIYEDNRIGSDFRTGHNVVVREGNVIGDNVSIGTNTVLEFGNKIGNNVRIHSNCFLEMVSIGDDVFIGPNVVFTDDLHMPCPRYKDCVGGVIVMKGAKIGAGSIILPGVKIGKNAVIGAGSVVVKDVPENVVVVGNPAKVIKNVDDLKCRKNFYVKPYSWLKTNGNTS